MFAVLLLILSSMALIAQSRQTITNDDLVLWSKRGFYGAFDYTWSSAGKTEFSVNKINAMYMPNHNLGLGFGFATVTRNKLTHCGISDLYFGGPQVEYFPGSHKLLFPSFYVLGGIAYCRDCINKDRVLSFIEPGAKLWLNLASFMRVSVNMNYRYFENDASLKMKEVNGFSFGFSVAYGKF